MTITIFYFAQLAEERGTRKEIISLKAEELTIQSLFVKIFERNPKGIRFAQNQEYVEGNTYLTDGDEIAFIPPLGGG